MSDNYTIDDFFKQDHGSPKKEKKGKPEKPKKAKKINETDPGKGGGIKGIFKAMRGKVAAGEENEEIKEEYPKEYKVMTSLKVIFWVAFFVAAVYGAVQFVFPAKPKIIREAYIPAISEMDVSKTFALQYVRDYLTYNEKDLGEYAQRLNKYLAENLNTEDKKGWSKVIESNVYNTKKLDDKNSVVTVYSKVLQGSDENDQGKEREIYIKVSVRAKDDTHFCVLDYPVFVHPVEQARLTRSSYNGQMAIDTTRNEVKKMLDNFFKIYQEGSSEQISYFLKDAQKIKGYQGEYIYDGISNIEVYTLNKEESRVFCMVEINLKDNFRSSFRQKYNFLMEKKEVDKEIRWYIEKFIETGAF